MPQLTRTDRPAARALALGAALALVVAACGGGSSPAPGGESSAPGQSNGPGASLPAGATSGPGASLGGATGDTAFGAATTALDGLDSYTFKVEIKSTTVSGSVTSGSHTVLSGVVTKKPDVASSLDEQELDADGNVTSETGIIVIGDRAFLNDGGASGTWTEVPSAMASTFIQSMSAFRPEQMFGLYFAGLGGDFHSVGSESKNGVDCTHYQGDEAVGALLGSIAGFQGTWTSDVWIANSGGFLVHSEAGGQGTAGGEGGSYLIVVDISNPNASGPIPAPSVVPG